MNHNRDAKYPPFGYRDPWTAFAICSVVNEFAMMAVYFMWFYERSKRMGKYFRLHASKSGWPLSTTSSHCGAGHLYRGSTTLRNRVRIACAFFFLSSIAGAVVGLTLAAWGCDPFNRALGAAPSAVVVAAAYSWFQIRRRSHDFDRAYPP